MKNGSQTVRWLVGFVALVAVGAVAGAPGAEPGSRRPSAAPSGLGERSPAAGGARAPEPRVQKAVPARSQAAPAGNSSTGRQPPPPGVVIALDPATGDVVRPTTAQMIFIGQGLDDLAEDMAESVVIALPDGSRGSYLGRRFARALVAHIGPTGKATWGCGPLHSSVPARVPVIAPEE